MTALHTETLRDVVEQELAQLFSQYATRAQAYGPEFAHLWTLAARHVQGGKLIRPVLLLEAYEALRSGREASPVVATSGDGGPSPSPVTPPAAGRAQAVRVAAAVEALHYAFLVHDDLIDGDVMRRGRPNLIGELAGTVLERTRTRRRLHWAETGGILAGDLLLSAAHQQFARVDLPTANRTRLLDLLEHTIIETTAGELTDVGLADGIVAPDLGTILAMTARKTASYTFELPLRAAVILAGGSPELEAALSSAGYHLGLAYQLQDDLLSTFGDPAVHGKDPYSDLREGKQTAIVCFARMTSAWPSIEADFGDPELSVESAMRIRELLTECGAEQFARGLVEEQLTAFYGILAGGSGERHVPAEVREVLLNLVARIEGRQS